MSLAQALFAPRAVALVGASGDAGKNTARPQRYLKKHGYAGRVVPINPTRGEVLGERAYARVADAPGDIDHVFVMAPGEAVEQALEDCGKRGVPVMSVYSDGFADAGAAGAARQARLAARVAIEARDGRREEFLQPTRIGDPDAPLQDAQLDAKYLELAGPVLGEAKAKELLDRLWRLEALKSLDA